MSSPTSQLHRSIVLALKNSVAVGAQVGDRIYDRVPKNAVLPYLTVRLDDAVEDDDGCGQHWICSASVHVWSETNGRRQTLETYGPVREALDGIATVDGFRLNFGQFRLERTLDDPDGRTTHGVIVFEFNISAV